MAFYLLVLLYFILNMVIFIGHHFYSPVIVCLFNVHDWPFNLHTNFHRFGTDLIVNVNLICEPVKDSLWKLWLDMFALTYLQNLSLNSYACSYKGREMVPGYDSRYMQENAWGFFFFLVIFIFAVLIFIVLSVSRMKWICVTVWKITSFRFTGQHNALE